MNEDLRRSWNSVCSDCERYRQALCTMKPPTTEAEDSFAAICEWFVPARDAQGVPSSQSLLRKREKVI